MLLGDLRLTKAAVIILELEVELEFSDVPSKHTSAKLAKNGHQV